MQGLHGSAKTLKLPTLHSVGPKWHETRTQDLQKWVSFVVYHLDLYGCEDWTCSSSSYGYFIGFGGGGASVFAKWSVVLLVNAAAIKDCCCLMCIQSAWKDDRFLPLHRVFLFKEHKSSDFLNESICGTESPWFPFILYEMEVNLNPLETHLKKLNSSKWMFCLYSLLYCRSSAWQRVKSTYWFKMSSPFMACTCCWMSKCKYKE